MNLENVNLDTPLSDYEAATAEIIKMFDFLPEDENIRRQYLGMIVMRLLFL